MIEVSEIVEIINITVDETTESVSIDLSEQQTVINIEVSEMGLRGIPGEDGTNGSGTTNVFIQETNPNLPSNYIWFEIDNTGSLTTMWVNTI